MKEKNVIIVSTLDLLKGFCEAKNLNIILTETDSILDFYKNRYVDNGQVNYKFRTLNLRNSDYPKLVKNVLLGNTIDLESKVFCITIIISRFRNNLFHGLKNLAEISTQEPLFEINNSYISKLIERIDGTTSNSVLMRG